MVKNKYILLFLFLFLLCSCTGKQDQPNVLFICVDDLRPELGCYGNSVALSPNLDELASDGIVFLNHFVQVPTCGASRYSMLTGRLPRKRSELGNEAIRQNISGKQENMHPETFIHQLRRNGYYTVGIGKISHYVDGRLYGYNDPVGTDLELPNSWDEMLFDPGKWGTGWNAFFGYADGSNRQSMNKMVKPYEAGDVTDAGYPDGLTTNLAIDKLHELKNTDQPFLLAIGFFKPHLPFNSPKSYWDEYDEASIPLSPIPLLPENVNRMSLHSSGEFNQYALGEEMASLDQKVSDAYARKIRHAYLACITYIDAQIGKVLYELKRLGLDKNTVIVVWGDHGWHLGDQLVWGKHTIFEQALKSALIIREPGKKQGPSKCNKVVSSIDIFPTMLELCGIDSPNETDGESLVPLLRDPGLLDWSERSYGYYRNGITLRTERYRLTKYFRNEYPIIELYDHFTDPYESKNIADEYPHRVDSLLFFLEEGNLGLYDN
jgi:arylsulfatase A-like enzyme